MIGARRATSSRTGIHLATPDNLLVLRHRVDWRAVLEDLRGCECSGYRLAALLGIEWSTVQRWLQGSEPRHSYGVAILEVHTRFCGAAMSQQRLCEAKLCGSADDLPAMPRRAPASRNTTMEPGAGVDPAAGDLCTGAFWPAVPRRG